MICLDFKPSPCLECCICSFFWVSPRRQIVVCRRFGTLCQFHLQRLDVEYEVWIMRGRVRPLIIHTSYSTSSLWRWNWQRVPKRRQSTIWRRGDAQKKNIHKIWYGLNSKWRPNTRQTVGCGIPSSLLALRVDLRGLRSKLSWIRLTFSSDTRGRPEFLPLHRQPICSNWWFQRQMLFLVGGWVLKRRRNASCTAVADSVLMNSRTQKRSCVA